MGPPLPKKLPAGMRISPMLAIAILIARTEERADILDICGSGYNIAASELRRFADQLRRARAYLAGISSQR